MRTPISAHFYDPETNKRLVVTDILASKNVEYLKSIWMIPSYFTNRELLEYFTKKNSKKIKQRVSI